MVFVCPFLTTAAQVRRLRISLPLIEPLLDGRKYFLPDDLPPASGEELRPMLRPRITNAPRGPTFRSLVKLAVKCDSAEQLGEQLRRRYQRQQQRAGIDTGRVAARDERELERLLGRP